MKKRQRVIGMDLPFGSMITPRKVFFLFFLSFVYTACESDLEGELIYLPQRLDSNGKNIIFILVDDLGVGDLSCYRNSKVQTPNIDKLASSGLLFNNCYSASSTCTPSRAAIFTARYPIRSGMVQAVLENDNHGISQDEVLLPEVLKVAGYTNGLFGKWHLGNLDKYNPVNHGFDYFYGSKYSNDIPGFSLYRNLTKVDNNPDQSLLIKKTTNEAINFVTNHLEVPFGLFLFYNAPHEPVLPSQEFKNLSGNGAYYDVVLELDHHIGRLFDFLKEKGLYDDSIIIFTSDNGANTSIGKNGGSNKPYIHGKNTVFEGGFRVPLVIYEKSLGVEQINIPIVTFDLYPTILQMLNINFSFKMDGESFIDKFDENIDYQTEFSFYYWRRNEIEAVRKNNYKFIEQRFFDYTLDEPRHLYNLSLDPTERNNLINEKSSSNKMEMLLRFRDSF